LSPALAPSLRRRGWALLWKSPAVEGWCRPRGRGAALALSLEAQRGLGVSAETGRRGLHNWGWRWKRAQLTAQDNDPERPAQLARIRWAGEAWRPRTTLVFADQWDLALLPKSGYPWRPPGTPVEVLTPGSHEKYDWAGAGDSRTGGVHDRVGARQTNPLFRNLLDALEARYPARRSDRISVVVDNYRMHQAQAVERWLSAHPRFERLWLPTYCPPANPMERLFGDTPDKVTRNHKRTRWRDLVAAVGRYRDRHGPWFYRLSTIYQEPEVTAALRRLKRCQELA
jgi:DDE superfamily endonuclease